MPVYETRNGNLSDVHFILQNSLSRTSAAELDNAGYSWWEALKQARVWLQKGETEVFLENGVPIAIFGHYTHESYSGRSTWFICTQRWWTIGARGVLLGRKYLKSLQIRWPSTVFYSQPRVENDHTIRWFSLLGFEPVYERRQIVGFRLNPAKSSDTAPVAC